MAKAELYCGVTSQTRLALLVALFLGIIGQTLADTGLGSAAPPIQIKQWIKGTPIKALAKNRTYVIDFWATWCGPCIQSMPHLTELARSNPDVTFLGVGIWEDDDNGSIRRFVQKMGSKMGFTVAYSGNQEGMAKTWVHAAARYSIPNTFVVRNGVVQWIGHPGELDGVLPQVKSGRFDLAKFKAAYSVQAKEARKQNAGNDALAQAIDLFRAGKRKEAHALLLRASKLQPSLAQAKSVIEMQWLALENPAAWDKAMRSALASKDEAVQQRAWSIAQMSTGSRSDWPVARRAATLILSVRGKNDFRASMLAVIVYQGTHEYALALKHLDVVEKALPKQPNITADYKARLATLRAEIKKQAGGLRLLRVAQEVHADQPPE